MSNDNNNDHNDHNDHNTASTDIPGSDASAIQARVDELVAANAELTELNRKLQRAQDQLLQSEKLASIGQLAAGVAHEINNPVGYVFSNFGTLTKYLDDLFRMLAAYEAAEPELAHTPAAAELAQLRADIELDYLKDDVPQLMAESREGITRVRKIVQDLKDFSHVDARQEWEWTDLHRGIDSTLNIVSNEIKYKADVVRAYGTLPQVQCLSSELNQVFMNLLVNAAHAITAVRGTIHVRSGVESNGSGEFVWVEVEDNGCGIAKENLGRIFDPFFTTKPVGKGTGLGLSLSYGIVKKHNGVLSVDSEPGRGTRLRVTIPVKQPQAAGTAAPRLEATTESGALHAENQAEHQVEHRAEHRAEHLIDNQALIPA